MNKYLDRSLLVFAISAMLAIISCIVYTELGWFGIIVIPLALLATLGMLATIHRLGTGVWGI